MTIEISKGSLTVPIFCYSFHHLSINSLQIYVMHFEYSENKSSQNKPFRYVEAYKPCLNFNGKMNASHPSLWSPQITLPLIHSFCIIISEGLKKYDFSMHNMN